mgnify:CR=1 FL=1
MSSIEASEVKKICLACEAGAGSSLMVKNSLIKKAKKAIERVELSKAVDKLPSEISGGMQKRVAIARAIVMNPKYLFCDEPNSGLDPKTAIVIDKLIQEITREFNITTIINSHDMNSVVEIGEKIVFLVSGVKNWEGTNKEILKTDNKSVTDFVYSSELLKKVDAEIDVSETIAELRRGISRKKKLSDSDFNDFTKKINQLRKAVK